jgi:hypothetical protein
MDTKDRISDCYELKSTEWVNLGETQVQESLAMGIDKRLPDI